MFDFWYKIGPYDVQCGDRLKITAGGGVFCVVIPYSCVVTKVKIHQEVDGITISVYDTPEEWSLAVGPFGCGMKKYADHITIGKVEIPLE